jgi:hypothetical protein
LFLPHPERLGTPFIVLRSYVMVHELYPGKKCGGDVNFSTRRYHVSRHNVRVFISAAAAICFADVPSSSFRAKVSCVPGFGILVIELW